MPLYKVTLKVTAEILVELEAENRDEAEADAVQLMESSHIPTTMDGCRVHVYVQDIDDHRHNAVVVEEA